MDTKFTVLLISVVDSLFTNGVLSNRIVRRINKVCYKSNKNNVHAIGILQISFYRCIVHSSIKRVVVNETRYLDEAPVERSGVRGKSVRQCFTFMIVIVMKHTSTFYYQILDTVISCYYQLTRFTSCNSKQSLAFIY